MFVLVYRFLLILVNATWFKNTFVRLTRTSKSLSYTDMSILERFFWAFFPNTKSVKYNYLNSDTRKLINLRGKYFGTIGFKIKSYYAFSYSIPLKHFNKYVNFLNFAALNSNFFLKTVFLVKNKYLATYLLFYVMRRDFYRHFSLLFFKDKRSINLIKINFFLLNHYARAGVKRELELLNLCNSSDWYEYTFNNTSKNYLFLTSVDLQEKQKLLLEKFITNYDKKIKAYVFIYKIVYADLVKKGWLSFCSKLSLFHFTFDMNRLHKVVFLGPDFVEILKSVLPVKFSEKSTNKFINLFKVGNFSFFYLRKNKIFNKGRYSRNRQTYRTGFYWSLWVNIFVIYGLHFVFYRFAFTFGYLWLPLILFFGLFLFSRIIKYNFHNYRFIFAEFTKLYVLFGLLYVNFVDFFLKSFNFLVLFFRNSDLISVNTIKINSGVVGTYVYPVLIDTYVFLKNKNDRFESALIWQSLKGEDSMIELQTFCSVFYK